MIKLRLRCMRHMAYMEEMRSAYEILDFRIRFDFFMTMKFYIFV
jgi:hypothetical protein